MVHDQALTFAKPLIINSNNLGTGYRDMTQI
uniref:Uncharacterized protein n=1 Tax=Trichinella nativa TaxID=6335 RepID=A0A0V1KJB4_9BILA